ncbi:MAG: hypothetical protein EPN60_04355 [Nevskiaceae bacterium]|nr:MAG: hypothetical protein EPO48_12165 [Nevskiaceae bacterium]TAM31411.1 MAG: hypothetical protein EPN60_04355 [Nevskiaceae bacterium]
MDITHAHHRFARETEGDWILIKLAKDQPAEVLEFVRWLLWCTDPKPVPTPSQARAWMQVLTQRPDESDLEEAQKELIEFLQPQYDPEIGDMPEHVFDLIEKRYGSAEGGKVLSTLIPFDTEALRRAALDAADRSCDLAGLPPATEFARQFDDKIINGEMTVEQVIDALTKHHKK